MHIRLLSIALSYPSSPRMSCIFVLLAGLDSGESNNCLRALPIISKHDEAS